MSDLILHNGNGRTPAKRGADYCTRDEAAEMAQRAAILVTEHMAAQIPALVGQIVEAALRAYDESVRGPASTYPAGPTSLNDVILAQPENEFPPEDLINGS